MNSEKERSENEKLGRVGEREGKGKENRKAGKRERDIERG